MKITVVGAGYVGLSLSTLLSMNNDVIILDIDSEKVDNINKRISPIDDKELKEFFNHKKLNLYATIDMKSAYENAEFVIICVPTNFNENNNSFDLSIINNILFELKKLKFKGTIVIKSTVPIGYTKFARKKFNLDKILFCPEFLRESKALFDNLYPSRIIVGASKKNYSYATILIELLKNISMDKNVKSFIIGLEEAESVKLFSNAYLAMRVSFFNELDTFAKTKKLDTLSIINGVCSDKRIGAFYNNPSFGYGGYCLPKDTLQLLCEYKDIPNALISAICESNVIRKEFIATEIINQIEQNSGNSEYVLGVYRLIMKTGSDNFRNSAIFDVIDILKKRNIKIVIYEPSLKEKDFYYGLAVINNLIKFKNISSLIIANRIDDDLEDVLEKVYSRDIFRNN